MSDARNSSNNIRGGGAKQTGGGGRTNKNAQGNNKKNLLAGLDGQVQAERSETKRKLQLLASSKQLASDVRALLLEAHTEQEYTDSEIPLPSTEDAKKKLKSMKEFTDKWYDKGFREEWLQTVTGVWIAEIKAQYEAAVAAAAAARQPQKQEVEEEPVGGEGTGEECKTNNERDMALERAEDNGNKNVSGTKKKKKKKKK